MLEEIKEQFTLNPDSEFEAALIDIVNMHRIKSQTYGSLDDPFFNFTVGAENTSSTPLRYGESLLSKHLAAIRVAWNQVDYAPYNIPRTPAMDDAYLDRAVYSVILLALYKRMELCHES